MRGLIRLPMLVLLCGLLLATAAFKGCPGKAPACDNPPCATPTPDAAAEHAKAVKYARVANNSFKIVAPLFIKDAARRAAFLGDGDKLVAAVEATDASGVVAALNDLLPTFQEIAAEHTDSVAVQIAFALADQALSYFADRVSDAVQAGAVPISKSASSKMRVVLAFRDGDHLRARSKKTGQFVSLDYAQAHPDEVRVEKFARGH